MKFLLKKQHWLIACSWTFLSLFVASFEAMAARVEADVDVTKPSKSDSDSTSSIALLITTRDLSVKTDKSWAEADASIWTLFYSSAYARGEADGSGYSFDATASTFYHGEIQDYKNVWGPKSLNVVLPNVLLDFSGDGLASYGVSFFETDDPTNVFFEALITYSLSGLDVTGDLSLSDFSLTSNGYLLTNTNFSIDDSLIPTGVDLTFANMWHAEGAGSGSANSSAIPEPSSGLLLGLGIIVLGLARRKGRAEFLGRHVLET